MSFQVHPIHRSEFEPYFGADEAVLAKAGIRRVRVDTSPGFPCRVSLRDAEIGESVLLLNYTHQPEETPYRASHAIFVIEGAEEAQPKPDDVPPVLQSRLISLRAFNAAHDMVDADVMDGRELSTAIERYFEQPDIAYLHAHNAKPGCFAARIERA